ncbi:hypothetical protein D3C76_1135420 [compost metagenome]|uniref:Cell division protein ZapB n=1 Tax=Pseudomonas jinjuensis TaxID=198616 RepID=A0A1H0KQC3_9PSED|nr:hypothetical protein [Pseudomonas jinjuensis]SDO57996.1 hypothetical protein SAMN05216193_11316 [Pseudomonas jinjuensis]
MLDATLEQLEQLIGELLQQNQQLTETNAQLNQQLLAAREENDSLQLSLLEQEEKHSATAVRLQNLLRRVSDARVGA